MIAALLFAAGASAQSLSDALKNIASSVADKVTGGALTSAMLTGEWRYEGPGVKFAGGNLLAEAGGAAVAGTVESKLGTIYSKAGIKPGACTFVFDKDNNFTMTAGSRTLSGTYEFNSSTHAITLQPSVGKLKLVKLGGYVYMEGTDLQLVFPADKLVDLVTALGSKISSLSTVTSLLEKYDSVMIGFKFTK